MPVKKGFDRLNVFFSPNKIQFPLLAARIEAIAGDLLVTIPKLGASRPE